MAKGVPRVYSQRATEGKLEVGRGEMPAKTSSPDPERPCPQTKVLTSLSLVLEGFQSPWKEEELRDNSETGGHTWHGEGPGFYLWHNKGDTPQSSCAKHH